MPDQSRGRAVSPSTTPHRMPAVLTVTLSPDPARTPAPAKDHPHREWRTRPHSSSPGLTSNTRPRPRPPLHAPTVAVIPARLPVTAGLITAGRLRTRPLRRPPEQHPLQHRKVCPQTLQLARLLRVLRTQPGVLLAQLSHQPRHLLIRLQRSSQHVPQRCLSTLGIRDNACHNHHAAQQTPSAAADHAPPTACRNPTMITDADNTRHSTSEYVRRFSQELGLHAQFTNFLLQFAESGSLADGQWWFLAGVLAAVGVDPVAEGAFLDVQLTGDLSDRL